MLLEHQINKHLPNFYYWGGKVVEEVSLLSLRELKWGLIRAPSVLVGTGLTNIRRPMRATLRGGVKGGVYLWVETGRQGVFKNKEVQQLTNSLFLSATRHSPALAIIKLPCSLLCWSSKESTKKKSQMHQWAKTESWLFYILSLSFLNDFHFFFKSSFLLIIINKHQLININQDVSPLMSKIYISKSPGQDKQQLRPAEVTTI